MTAKLRALIKRPDEDIGHVTAISPRLENLQRIVQGYIETVTVAKDVVIICNEEGRIYDMPANCIVKIQDGPNKGCTVSFVGEIIALGVDGDEFVDLPGWVTRRVWEDKFLFTEA